MNRIPHPHIIFIISYVITQQPGGPRLEGVSKSVCLRTLQLLPEGSGSRRRCVQGGLGHGGSVHPVECLKVCTVFQGRAGGGRWSSEPVLLPPAVPSSLILCLYIFKVENIWFVCLFKTNVGSVCFVACSFGVAQPNDPDYEEVLIMNGKIK